jgi:cysteine sulfinate desulfinase/cysteine desulfurase-like protein
LRPEATAPWNRSGVAPSISSGGHPSPAAKTALEEAREEIAELRARSPKEVVFTAGGTEADNPCSEGRRPCGAATGGGGAVVTAFEHKGAQACDRLVVEVSARPGSRPKDRRPRCSSTC